MNVSDCLAKGLLVASKPDFKKAVSSLAMAEHKLVLAKKELEHKIFENALISAYTAMFHCARALLFKDGFKERSHFALYVYVNEKYESQIKSKYLSELDALRLQRHDLMYGFEKRPEIQAEEAKEAVQTAHEFLESVEKILKKNAPNKTKK